MLNSSKVWASHRLDHCQAQVTAVAAGKVLPAFTAGGSCPPLNSTALACLDHQHQPSTSLATSQDKTEPAKITSKLDAMTTHLIHGRFPKKLGAAVATYGLANRCLLPQNKPRMMTAAKYREEGEMETTPEVLECQRVHDQKCRPPISRPKHLLSTIPVVSSS